MGAVEIGEHPLSHVSRIDVLDAQPRPQDRMGQQALGKSGVRWGRRVVVHVREALVVVRPHLADLKHRPRAAGRRGAIDGTDGEDVDRAFARREDRSLVRGGEHFGAEATGPAVDPGLGRGPPNWAISTSGSIIIEPSWLGSAIGGYG